MDLKSHLPLKFFTICIDKFSLPELNSDYVEDSAILNHLCSSQTCVQLVGSYAEGLQLPPYYISGGSDYDMFLIINNETPELQTILGADDFTSKLKRTEDLPGYVSLPIDINCYITKDELRSAAKRVLQSLFPEKALFTMGEGSLDSGPAIAMDKGYTISYVDDTKFDFVPALKMKGWPKEATTWITRMRKTNWPSPDLVNRIVSEGFHLVNKYPIPYGSSSGKEDELVYYWRLSFSLAETIIARSLSSLQRQCIILMKMLKEKLPGNIVTTYHIKTLVYWTFESMPQRYLTTDNLGKLFLFMLDQLVYSLAKKALPHYFLDAVNLFSGITHDHILTVLKQVLFYRKHPLGIFKGSLTGGLTPLSTSYMKDREGNLRRLANRNRCLKTLDMTDTQVLVYQREDNMILNETSEERKELDNLMETKCYEKILDSLTELSENLDPNASWLDEDVDIPLEATGCKSDIDLLYQIAKEHVSMLEDIQKEKVEMGLERQVDMGFSEELLQHLKGVSESPDDITLIEEAAEHDVEEWLTLTFDGHDFHQTVFTTLYDLCSLNSRDTEIHDTLIGLLDGLQIFMEWALSKIIPTQEVKEYFDEAYMTRFLQKDAICNTSKLKQQWKSLMRTS